MVIADLVADCVDAAADELITAAGGPPREEAAFTALVATAKAELHRLTVDAVQKVEDVLTRAREVAVAIGGAPARRVPEAAVADLRLSETSAALRTEFTFEAAPAAEPPAEPTAERPPDPPASPKRSYEDVNGPVPTGPVIDENGLAQQVREEPDEPLRGSLLDPESLRELA